ncbi:FAD-binding protein [Deinococcus altitudinis]|uniref:FAD-binding protein n=1 Tax=Deinococcus altitudinis TaxID=468914 RepID=UPI0038914E50
MSKQQEVNWGGNVTYRAPRLHHPETPEELRRLIGHAEQVRMLGTRHTFNALPDTPGDLISLKHFDRILALDPQARTVTVEGGVQYGELGPFLHAQGFALGNLASLPHLSVAGACSTGTHGSGLRHQGLASAVVSLELLTADGEQVTCSREQSGERFDGMVVALGALGAVTQLTLSVEPTYQVRQDVYEALSLDQVAARFGEVMAAGDSVSLFTDWQHARFDTLWLKRRVVAGDLQPAPAQLFGGVLAERDHHPVWDASAENCTVQRGVPGAWHERWPHFRAGRTPSSGQELQSEYLLPVEDAPAAIRAMFSIGARIAPLLYVSEVRAVAADSLWLSPAYGHGSAAIHFTWRPDEPAVRSVLHEVEAVLAPFGARPHWGKVFETTPEQLERLVPRLADFRQLARSLDPAGKFRNSFLDRSVFGA